MNKIRKNKYFIRVHLLKLKDLKSKFLLFLFYFFISTSSAKNYYVALNGKNTNKGTLDDPFYSIQFASKKLNPGDTLYIRGGIYYENCSLKLKGTKNNRITIQSFKNEKVVFASSTLKLNWKQISRHIFRAKINSKITQVFLNYKPLMQASFPNIIEGEMNKDKWLNVYSKATKEIELKIPKKSNLIHSKFIGICGRGTICITGKVTDQYKNSVQLSNKDFYWNNKYKTAYLGKGKGYFIGNLSFLDTINEWYSNDEYIYWYGKPPSHKNLILRTENDEFILNQCSFVTLKGLHFIGKSISFGNSTHCILTKSRVEFPTPFFNFEYSFDRGCNPENDSSIYWRGKGIIFNGSYNQIQHSSISKSWGDGITTYGKNNKLYNSFVSDCNWMGTDAAALNFYGENHIVKHCFLSKTGRSVILHSNSKNCKILYNEISEGGYLCDDLGLTYNYGTDGKGTEIAYNWLHHNRAPHYGSGIYLDNGNSNFKVHHNVVWKCFVGLTINETATDDSIYNNTFFKNKYTMGSGWFSEFAPKIIHVSTFNNITDSDLKARDQQPFYGTSQKNNKFIPHLTNFLVNPSTNDFRINSNKLSYEDQLGAYDSKTKWKAGLIYPFDNNSMPPFYQSIAYYLISYLIILILLSLLILKSNFYQLKTIEPIILFGITIISGIAYFMIFTYIYPNRETAEIFKHFDDAKLIYNNIFSKDKYAYFNFLINGNETSELKELLHQTNFWYKLETGTFNENQFLIKFHSWLLPISGGNIFMHLLIFSFIAFHGMITFFKHLEKHFNATNSIIFLLFILPSFWLFASSATKDSLLFFTLAFLFYFLDDFNLKKPTFWIVILFGFYFLILLRPYLFIAFIPFLGIRLITKFTKNELNGWVTFSVYLVTLLILLQINQIHLFETLKFKQQDLILVAKEMHASTSFDIASLIEPIDLLKNSLSGIYNVLFRPLNFQTKNWGLLLMCIENWFIIGIIIFSIIKSVQKRVNPNWNLLLFCLLVFLIIGWTIPISGVILRFRAIILPFFILSLFQSKKQNTINQSVD